MKKRGMELEVLGWWILGIVILAKSPNRHAMQVTLLSIFPQSNYGKRIHVYLLIHSVQSSYAGA